MNIPNVGSVTANSRHYSPTADGGAQMDATVQSTGTYAINTQYAVVTGVQLQRDSKGHVVGVQVQKQNVKDTNTDTKVTSLANHWKGGDKGVQSLGNYASQNYYLYVTKMDSAGHIIGFQGAQSTDLLNILGEGTTDYTNLQNLVNSIKAELENPDSASGLNSVLDSITDVLGSSTSVIKTAAFSVGTGSESETLILNTTTANVVPTKEETANSHWGAQTNP